MLISMALEKIDPSDIEFNNKLQVYRAFPQGFVESDIFYNTKQIDSPFYMARTGDIGTFVSTDFLTGLGHGRDIAASMAMKEMAFPFTEYITFIGINAEPYFERLYKETSSSNKAILIRGPIDLKDIEVFYCAERIILDDPDLDAVVLPSIRFDTPDLRRTYQRKKSDLSLMAGDPPEHTLTKRYEENPETLVEQIHTYLESLPEGADSLLTKSGIAGLLPQVVSKFRPLNKGQ